LNLPTINNIKYEIILNGDGMMLYQIKYSDGTIFCGGDYNDSKWKEINKPIAEIIYNFQGKAVVLKGYESYNHQFIIKNMLLSGRKKLFGILLIAKEKNIIHCFCFNPKNQKLDYYKTEYTKKFQSPQMTGWKMGVSSEKPSFTIL